MSKTLLGFQFSANASFDQAQNTAGFGQFRKEIFLQY